MIHCQAYVVTQNADIVSHYQSMVQIACFVTAFSCSVRNSGTQGLKCAEKQASKLVSI